MNDVMMANFSQMMINIVGKMSTLLQTSLYYLFVHLCVVIAIVFLSYFVLFVGNLYSMKNLSALFTSNLIVKERRITRKPKSHRTLFIHINADTLQLYTDQLSLYTTHRCCFTHYQCLRNNTPHKSISCSSSEIILYKLTLILSQNLFVDNHEYIMPPNQTAVSLVQLGFSALAHIVQLYVQIFMFVTVFNEYTLPWMTSSYIQYGPIFTCYNMIT